LYGGTAGIVVAMFIFERLVIAARLLWAAPNSLLGLLPALVLLAGGGHARWFSGALEVCYRVRGSECGRLARALPFRAMVMGHVILAVTEEELSRIGPHERVHVRQYERWGPLFIPAYAASSLWRLLQGKDPYWDNHFEVQARALAPRPHTGHDGCCIFR
jgi:hypothetical protein